jgi:putative membrane protein
MITKLVYFLVLLLAVFCFSFGVLFYINNSQAIAVDLLFVTLPAYPVASALLVSLIVGFFVGLAVSSLLMMRLRAQKMVLQRKLNKQG